MAQKPLVVDAFIEIPKNSTNKYEYDKELHVFRLDRTLYSPVHYPTDYGYLPETLAEDGDPLDAMVLVSNPTFPGCMVAMRVLGALQMTDEKGLDTKILGVFPKDPRLDPIQQLKDVPPHILREIEHFFVIYKQLEGKEVHVEGWKDLDFAVETIEAARKAYVRSR